MTEPKRWTAPATPFHPCENVTVEVVAAADFDRLRDERDRLARVILDAAQISSTLRHAEQTIAKYPDEFHRLHRERDEARRVAGVLADALRNAPCYCDHRVRAGLPPCSRCSALAVFDTLTEDAEPEPEPMVFVHEGEDCGGPIVRTLRYGDSVTIQVTGQESYHVRFDDEDTAAMRPFDTLTEANPAPHGAPSAHERGGRA